MDKFPAPVSPEELKVLIIDNQGLVHDQIISALRDSGVEHISSAFNAFHAMHVYITWPTTIYNNIVVIDIL